MLQLPPVTPPFPAASRPREPLAVVRVTLLRMRGWSAEALHKVRPAGPAPVTPRSPPAQGTGHPPRPLGGSLGRHPQNQSWGTVRRLWDQVGRGWFLGLSTGVSTQLPCGSVRRSVQCGRVCLHHPLSPAFGCRAGGNSTHRRRRQSQWSGMPSRGQVGRGLQAWGELTWGRCPWKKRTELDPIG